MLCLLLFSSDHLPFIAGNVESPPCSAAPTFTSGSYYCVVAVIVPVAEDTLLTVIFLDKIEQLNTKQIHINLSLIFTKQFFIKFGKFFLFINTYEFNL